MPVNSHHPELDDFLKKCALVRAITDNCAQKYIRYVDMNDPIRSQQYREDAILTNVTRLTRDGLVGLIFRKPPVIELPPEIEYLEDDATGEGVPLNQLLRKSCSEVLQTGRQVLLLDYPEVDAQGVRLARIKVYSAEAFLNFKRKQIGSEYVVYQMTLQEMVDMPDPEDPFTWNLTAQYRVLGLDQDNKYYQEVFNDKLVQIGIRVYPLDKDGNMWDQIPFVCLGSENNNPDFDSIPLYDLATVNLGHYRNSADYEESIFFTGQITPVVCTGETSVEQFQAANLGGIKFGSRAGVVLGQGGSLTLAQANANQLVAQAMKDKLSDCAAIGARVISPAGGRETAEAARIRFGSQNSSLHVLTNNISDGVEKLIKLMCRFEGGDENSVEILLNTEFYEDTADPNLVMAMLQMYDRKLMPAADITDYGRSTNFIKNSRTDEEIFAEAELNDPMIGTEDVPAG